MIRQGRLSDHARGAEHTSAPCRLLKSPCFVLLKEGAFQLWEKHARRSVSLQQVFGVIVYLKNFLNTVIIKNIDCYWKMLYNMFCIESHCIQEGPYLKLRFTDIRQRALKESLRLAQEKIVRHKKYSNNTVVNEKGIEEILIKVCKIDG